MRSKAFIITLRLSCAFFLHRLRLPQVPKIASAIENDQDCNIAHCHKLPLIRSMRCDLLARLNSWPASPRTLDSPLFLLPPLPSPVLSDPQLTRSLSGRPWRRGTHRTEALVKIFWTSTSISISWHNLLPTCGCCSLEELRT